MKIILSFLLFLFIVTPCFAMSGKVVKVTDGDTITVLTCQQKQVKVRLYGIDAPEKRQPFGQRAKESLSRLIAGKKVNVEETGKDRYGRVVGIVKAGSVNVNEKMIYDGFAWVYDSFCKKSFCSSWKDKQSRARAEKRGLWRDKNPVEPWKWRKQKLAV